MIRLGVARIGLRLGIKFVSETDTKDAMIPEKARKEGGAF